MRKKILQVRRYMRTFPHEIGFHQTVDQARRFMREQSIRHLPVLHGGAVVGLLTLPQVEAFQSRSSDASVEPSIQDVMSTDVLTVETNTPLLEVVQTMADKPTDCAVVVHDRRVVGIFTAVDVCRALADMLRD